VQLVLLAYLPLVQQAAWLAQLVLLAYLPLAQQAARLV
jgi:hypothetical protein